MYEWSFFMEKFKTGYKDRETGAYVKTLKKPTSERDWLFLMKPQKIIFSILFWLNS